MFRSLIRDARYGLRAAVKNPGFTLVIALTLGLGIGANTAIFSVVDAILLRPLPFNEPDQLMTVWADYTGRDGPEREWLSYPNFHDLRQQHETFAEVSVWSGWNPTLGGAGGSEAINAAFVSYGMFSNVLEVTPLLGRGFTLEDDQPGAPNVVVVSNAFWQQRFGGSPDIIGTTISLTEVPYTIVGVMPAGLRPPFVPNAEVWRTFQMNGTQFGGSRGSASYRAFGRLAPGVTVESARARASDLGSRLAQEYPGANSGVTYALFPLKSELTRTTKTPLWVLLGAVTFVLLIACVNVANLLLARATVRESELAVRAALGAGRRRLIRQLFTECAVFATIGGAIGVAFAFTGTRFLTGIAPAGTPRIGEVTVDARVLVFAITATIAATFAFGLLPALKGARIDLHEALRVGGRGMGAGRTGVRAALVIGQVALALILLVGAGLMIRSLRALNATDLGFSTENTLALQLNLPTTRYPDRTSWSTFYRDAESRLAVLPGVRSVGAISSLPMTGNDGDTNFQIQGRPMPEPGKENVLWFRRTTSDYFTAMQIQVLEGRGIAQRDAADAPPTVVINETLAQRQFPEGNAIGQRLNVNSFDNPVWREIVGVVRDIKNFGIRTESRQAAYFPFYQLPTNLMTVVVRASQDPTLLLPAIRTAVGELDPALAISNVNTMEEVVSASLGTERFVTALLASFAAVAFVLASIGLYGIVAYGVSQRVREMGVRIALGAGGANIRRLIVGHSVLLSTVGVVAGLVGGVILTRVMSGLVFGVSTTDPITFATAAILLVVVAAVAASIPAQRAVRVNPMTVLRQE